MSVIFGILKERTGVVAEPELRELVSSMERFSTGAGSLSVYGRLGVGLLPYLSHQRSELETGPVADGHGHVLAFDGRLDNHKELAELLGIDGSVISDSWIALSAFVSWGDGCFSRLIGDWALSIWSERDQILYLARDHAGTRTLYFRHEHGTTMWSTHLDPLLANRSNLALSRDYVAFYLACRPIRDLTPYEGVCSVPPAHYLVFHGARRFRYSHWSSTVTSAVRYKTDRAYEEQFRVLFQQSVERRTGVGAPVLAQLSGGMDSTAIVCISDQIRQASDPAAEILDTLSFFDDSESSLNDRPYFSLVEASRGKKGAHIDIAFSQRTFTPHDGAEGQYLLPGADSFSIEQEQRFCTVWQRGYRSVLSGIGGDEVLGGIPNALPELADHLVSGDVLSLLRRSVAWSLVDRKPLIGTLWDTVRYTAGLYTNSEPHDRAIPPWVSRSLRERIHEIEHRNPIVPSRFGAAPHRLDNSLAWWSVMETLPHLFPHLLYRPEYRYPFLDRDLVEYLFSIPREQLLRPGRRRSLMKRALAGIMPQEVLERRRKAFQLRAPLRTLQQAQPIVERLFADSMVASAGFIDTDKLHRAIRNSAQGDSEWWQALLKTIALELWLRSAAMETKHGPERGLDISLTA